MKPVLTPSTQWQERIAPDEAERHAHQARQFVEIQRRKSAAYGTGRALHRKQLTAAQGLLEVLDGLPPFAHHGLFAAPGVHDVWVRLSNGGPDRAGDRQPDIRGFAIKVFGVHGRSALGGDTTASQDFTLINQEAFGFTDSAEFTGFAVAASRSKAALLPYLFRRYGLLSAPAKLLQILRAVGRPFSGFATEPLHSAVPMACGPYAVRVRLLPDPSNALWEGGAGNAGARGEATAQARSDWGADFSARLRTNALHWDLQLQFFVNEELTPIEDASVNWSSPYTTVARLILPPQDTGSAEGQALAARAEAGVFDPWQALAEHRPLGDVQRARKVAYFASQQERGAA
ncbi:catalase [Variovorax terrae]|uniref:Catalase n=1 Tax=Variovorax terrae TaxID=2923278 RepID=A0A9X1VR95_9BURK|nr:catalase [Variovorax terrae]MCJ0762356.1 catalase [Variovorax terrae]